MKILVRNLSRDVTEEELLALFSAHGRVQSCTLVKDAVTGGSKGFGFANMPVPHEAKAAVQALNGLAVKGGKMRVKKADPAPKTAATSPEETEAARADRVKTEAAAEAVVAAAARARIKKDGSPLGAKKVRTFRKSTRY